MKNIQIFIFVSIFLSFSIKCKVRQFEINPMDQLNSIEKKKEFLTNLFNEDQKLRQGQDSKIMIEHGHKSEEFYAFIRKVKAQDSINLIKAESYLSKYGYPKLEEVGEIPTSAIWTVIHHSGNSEVLFRNFPYIYQAYLDEDLDDGALSFYLNGMYQIEFKERFRKTSTYSIKEEINTLIEVLNLQVP